MLPDNLPGIDMPDARKRIQDDDVIFEAVKAFIESHHQDMAHVKHALEAGRREDAVRLVHAVKGASGNISANRLYQTSLDLETALREEREEELSALLEKFSVDLAQVLSVEDIIKKQAEKTADTEVKPDIAVGPFRERVLIVDDDPANIRLIQGWLASRYHVSIAADGESALELAVTDPKPDIILLDIMMPGLSGYEVCRRLKADEYTQNIPVIFITAMQEETDETKGLSVGAVDYITKPFSMAIVEARVRTHLEMKRNRDLLQQLSSMDGLTGIPNRRRFDEYIETEWKRAERALRELSKLSREQSKLSQEQLKLLREQSKLSLIMADIDYFKKYNDHYGHNAGDNCLRRVARALMSALRRPSDIVARYGGEEFAMILPRTGKKGALHVGEQIRERVETLHIPHAASTVSPHVTISVGIATMDPKREQDFHDLMKVSDEMLYRAKSRGRNRVCADADG